MHHLILLLFFVFNCTKHCIQESRVNVVNILPSALYVSCDLLAKTVNVEALDTKLLWKDKLWYRKDLT